MYGKPLLVRAEWDEVARVWVATSDDVPGLATEEDNLEGLIEKLKVMIPELLDSLFHTEVKTTFARCGMLFRTSRRGGSRDMV